MDRGVWRSVVHEITKLDHDFEYTRFISVIAQLGLHKVESLCKVGRNGWGDIPEPEPVRKVRMGPQSTGGGS